LSLDWGAFSEVGLAAAQANRGARLASRGVGSLTPDEGLSALARLLDSDRVQVGVMPLNARQWLEFYPAAASSRLLSRLMAEQRAGAGRPAGDPDLVGRLVAADPAARAALLQHFLLAQVAQVLHIPEAKLHLDAPLTGMGMDSLMGLELRNRIEAALGITVPATLLWTYPTVAALSAQLTGGTREATPAESPQETVDAEGEIEGMSQEELERLIDAKFEVVL
jgi:acyl carrier protein